MTKRFLENPFRLADLDLSSRSERLLKHIETLSEITHDHYGKSDLELIMSLILELQDSTSKKLFKNTYKEIAEIEEGDLSFIRILINDYIRKECENIDSDSVEYLWPLQSQSLMSNKMKIFTLNYDGTIEIFCEKHSIVFRWV